MQLICLDRRTLNYKDHGFLDRSFEINLDLVIIQKSTFIINKGKFLASIGDIVILKDSLYDYIGIIERLEVTDEHRTTIHALDIRELFTVDVPVHSYTGDLALYLADILNLTFKNNFDPLQNLSYLSIVKKAVVSGELSFETDKIMSLSSLIELITKSYGLKLTSEVNYIRGRVTGITFKINEVNQGIKLKSNFKAIFDLVVNDSSNQMINKIIFYPKTDNVSHKNISSYYLLTTGAITQDLNDLLRYKNVAVKSIYYTDNDFQSLHQKARTEMLSSKLDHNIMFSIKTSNDIIKPGANFNLGDFVEFYHDLVTYDSVVTGIKFKDGFEVASITLGEYRIKLTEKIQLINRSINTQASQVTITSTGYTNLDGGEF